MSGWNPTITDITPADYEVRASVWNKVVVNNLPWLRRAYGFNLHLTTYTVIAPTAEVQKVASTGGTATGGSFRIGFTNNVYDKGVLISSVTTYTPQMAWNIGLVAFTAQMKALPGLADITDALGTHPSITVTGSNLNGGFTIAFVGQNLAGHDVPTLLEHDGGLTGDTITITTISSGDPYDFVFVQGAPYSPWVDTARPGDSNLEGLWWLHAHATLGVTSGSIEIRKADGTVLSHGDAAGSTDGTSVDTECVVDIAAGDEVSMWVYHPGVGVTDGAPLTYFEGYFLGVVGEEDAGP